MREAIAAVIQRFVRPLPIGLFVLGTAVVWGLWHGGAARSPAPGYFALMASLLPHAVLVHAVSAP